ncbi:MULTISPECIES: hypothetical protein [unclassified Kitasatospora]|uniref:hypothetical protein n=1 Tax=unclassified Kitasatospora TaxID=2633591 RepID=UPI00380A87F4
MLLFGPGWATPGHWERAVGAPAPVKAKAKAAITSNLGTYEATVGDKYLTDDIVYAVGK